MQGFQIGVHRGCCNPTLIGIREQGLEGGLGAAGMLQDGDVEVAREEDERDERVVAGLNTERKAGMQLLQKDRLAGARLAGDKEDLPFPPGFRICTGALAGRPSDEVGQFLPRLAHNGQCRVAEVDVTSARGGERLRIMGGDHGCADLRPVDLEGPSQAGEILGNECSAARPRPGALGEAPGKPDERWGQKADEGAHHLQHVREIREAASGRCRGRTPWARSRRRATRAPTASRNEARAVCGPDHRTCAGSSERFMCPQQHDEVGRRRLSGCLLPGTGDGPTLCNAKISSREGRDFIC